MLHSPIPVRRETDGPHEDVIAADMIAALDLGTNNCRLLIARRNPTGGFRIVDAFSRITRLGEGLTSSGRLSEPAIHRTIAALGVCRAKLAHRRVARGRYVATEACRRAENCTDFVARVRAETGITLEIIDPEEEARLAVAGCATLLDPQVPHAIVFDIGGGSTEIVLLRGRAGARRELAGVLSLPLGVVTVSERHDAAGDLSPETYDRMRAEMRAALAPFEAEHGIGAAIRAGEVQMLGTSGTVTTLAGIHFGLQRYSRAAVDGSWLRFSDIRAVSRALARMPTAARATVPCVGTERADLVVAGCAILEGICDTWPVGRLRVADRGVREGILIGLAALGTA